LYSLQESANAPHRCRTRFSPSSQIEYEARIPDRISSKSRWRGLAPIQELLDFT